MRVENLRIATLLGTQPASKASSATSRARIPPFTVCASPIAPHSDRAFVQSGLYEVAIQQTAARTPATSHNPPDSLEGGFLIHGRDEPTAIRPRVGCHRARR